MGRIDTQPCSPEQLLVDLISPASVFPGSLQGHIPWSLWQGEGAEARQCISLRDSRHPTVTRGRTQWGGSTLSTLLIPYWCRSESCSAPYPQWEKSHQWLLKCKVSSLVALLNLGKDILHLSTHKKQASEKGEPQDGTGWLNMQCDILFNPWLFLWTTVWKWWWHWFQKDYQRDYTD